MGNDYNNSKLYIKGTILIRRILFSKIIDAWNYKLDISDVIYQAKVAKDLRYQFVFLAKKIEDGYLNIFQPSKTHLEENRHGQGYNVRSFFQAPSLY